MTTSQPITRTFAAMMAAGLLALLLVPLAVRSSHAAANVYYVSPGGSDTNSGQSADAPLKSIQKAVDLAQPGATIVLAPGVYLQDIISRQSGTAEAPITIQGPADAVLKGAGKARIFEIKHDYITIEGFTIDGLWGTADSATGYREKLLFVLGKAPRDGVSGLRVLNMAFRNAGGECLRLRYFAQHNEIANSTFVNCGVNDFRFGGGGKNGEGVYIGTAPEQRGDGKTPPPTPTSRTQTGSIITPSTRRATNVWTLRKLRRPTLSSTTAVPVSATPIPPASTRAVAATSSATTRATATPAQAFGSAATPQPTA